MGLFPKPKDPSGAGKATTPAPAAPAKKGGLFPSPGTTKAPKPKAPTTAPKGQGNVDPTGSNAQLGMAFDFLWKGLQQIGEPVTKPVISSAGAILNTLNTGAAFTTGYVDQGLRDLQAGRIKDLGSYVETIGRSAAAGTKNATNWQRGKYVKSNSDILIERFGWEPSAATGLAGFVGDVVLDPINLIPFGAVGSIFKASGRALSAGADAGKAIRAGEASADVVAKREITKLPKKQQTALKETVVKAAPYGKEKSILDTPAGRIEASGVKPGSVKYQQRQAPLNMRMLPTEAGAKFEARIADIAGKYTYGTTPLTKAQLQERGLAQQFADSLSFSLEAGKKEFVSTILTDNAIRALNRATAKDIKKIWTPSLKAPLKIRREVRTVITKEGDRFVVKSGNGVEFGRSKTKAGAEKIAAKAKKEQSASELAINSLEDYKAQATPATMAKAIQASSKAAKDSADATVETAIKLATETEAGSVAKKVLADVQKAIKKTDAVSATGETVKYSNFDDLIQGMQNGDRINEDSLRDVLAIMDPERKVVLEAANKEATVGTDLLNHVLVKDGVQTIEETAKRIEKASDPRELLIGEGIGYGEVLAGYIKGLGDPASLSATNQDLLAKSLLEGNAATSQTAQAAAIRWSDSEIYSPRTRNLVENGLTRAFEARNLRIDRIQNSEEYFRDYSTLGQQTEFSSELKLLDDSEAVSANTFDTIIESELLTSVLAVNRAVAARNSDQLASSGKTVYNPKSPSGDEKTIIAEHAKFAEEQYRRIVETSSAASDLLMSSGIRIVNRKYTTDADFVKAYKRFGEDVRPKDHAYFAYATIGDVFSIFKETGYDDLLKRAFIPLAPGDAAKADTLLFMNLADATRAAMEMAEKGQKVNIKEVQTRLLKRYKMKYKWSPGYQRDMEAVIPQIAEALADPKVISKLTKTHLERSVGLINDYAAKVETVSQDISDAMREMWTAKVAAGDVSEVVVEAVLRDSFRKYIMASKIFEIEGGPAVKALFRSYANIFLSGAKLDTPIKDIIQQEFEIFHNSINKYFMSEKAADAAKLPERQGRNASPAVREKAQNKYVEQKTLYESHMATRAAAYGSNDLEVLSAWDARYTELQAGLDKARAAAYKKGVEVESFQQGQWIPMEKFSREDELADVTASQLFPAPVDSEALIPPKRLVVSEKTKEEIIKIQKELHLGRVQDAADDASKKMDRGDFAAAGDEVDQIIRATEDYIAKPLQQATRLTPVRIVAADYGTYKNNNYKPDLSDEERAAAGITVGERIAAVSARWSGPGGPAKETTQYLRVNEISAMNVSSDFAVYLKDLARKWSGVADNVMSQAWNGILRGKRPSSSNPAVGPLFDDLDRIFKLIIGSPSSNEFVRSGIELDDLIREASKFGFTPKNGFPAGFATKGMTISDFFKALPIGDKPIGVKKGTAEYGQWVKNRKVFKASDLNEFETLSALAHALQLVKLKKGLIEDFAVRQSYKFYGLSMDEALGAGFEPIKVIGGDPALSKYLPKPEDGGLYLPEAIDSFGATLREASAIYNREPSKFDRPLRTMMDVVGFVKSNQTVLVPGHQLTNMIGDTSIAINMGVIDPNHWGPAWRLANAHAVERAAGDWGPMAALYRDPVTGQNGIDKLEAQWRNLFRQSEADRLGKERKFEGSFAKVEKDKASGAWVVKNSRDEVVGTAPSKQAADALAKQRAEKTTGIVIYKSGKPTMVQFSDADLIDQMKRSGIIITNMFANDVQGLADYLDGAQKSDSAGKFLRKAGAKLGLAYRRVEKVPGDVIAWHGNVPRIAHAMKVLQSRSWASLDDAMAAASQRVLTYHPTVFSLRSSERRVGRAIFGYYTWIRVAHSAVLEMAMNQPALLTIPSKLQQNISKAQGFEPESIGMPFESRQDLPSYITKNVSPMLVGDKDSPFTVRLPFMQQSVFDTFNTIDDPSRTAEEGFFYNLTKNFGGVIAKNVNVVGNTLAELIFQVDPSTGTASKIKDLRTFTDSILGNFSIFQLIKGLGAYTPAARDDTTNNPLTEGERDTAEFNWYTRLGLNNPYLPANVTRSEFELRDQQSRIDKRAEEEFWKRYNK